MGILRVFGNLMTNCAGCVVSGASLIGSTTGGANHPVRGSAPSANQPRRSTKLQKLDQRGTIRHLVSRGRASANVQFKPAMEASMYQRILLCSDGSPAANVATDYAIWFARKLRARLRILYITDIRVLEGPLLADISGALGAQPYAALLPQLKQLQREKAETIFADAASRGRKAGVDCDTSYVTGTLVPAVLDHERDADLVVLGQRGEHARWLGNMLGSSVEHMIRASIKPCLVTPEEFRETSHILVAYDGSAESNKALRASLELAANLRVQFTVATVCQPEDEAEASRFLQQAQEQARQQKLAAEVQLLHGHAETEILRLCDRINADLIVMGAYGHTRIRELILGSTTSHVLRKATVPVLLTRG